MIKYRLHSFFYDERHTARRSCGHEKCCNEGLYPAPKSREKIREYYWFCLEHVRAYNKSWNYYDGMTSAAIEASRQNDVTWERPSWPFVSSVSKAFIEGSFRDPMGCFKAKAEASDASQETGSVKGSRQGASHSFLSQEERQALTLFDLAYPFSIEQLKIRYKVLAKQHHPDLHRGSKKSEEVFKKINLAYAILQKSSEKEK